MTRNKKKNKAYRNKHYKPKRIPKYNTKWQHLVKKRNKKGDKKDSK